MKSFKLLWSLPLIERHLMGKGNCNILYIVAVLTNDYYIYGDKCGWPTINYQVLPLCTHFGEITRLFLDKAQLSKINVVIKHKRAKKINIEQTVSFLYQTIRILSKQTILWMSLYWKGKLDYCVEFNKIAT